MSVDPAASADSTPFDRERTLAAVAYVLFAVSIVFQLTVLPDLVADPAVSVAVNGSVLAVVGLLVLHCIATRRPSPTVMWFYVLPIALVLAGFALNLALNLGVSSIGYLSIFLPFLAAASIPMLPAFSFRTAWNIYYWMMLGFCLLGLAEYAAVFSGLLPTQPFDDRDMLRGLLTIYYDYGGPVPHNRFYGVFPEPGTAAMLVLPAFCHAVLRRRIVGVVAFAAVFALSESLGGWLGVAIAAGIIGYVLLDHFPRLGRARQVILIAAVPVAVGLAVVLFLPEYADKRISAQTREDNIVAFLTNFPTIVAERPFGFPLIGTALSNLAVNDDYLGSTFMIYVAFVEGGVLSLVGYVALLALALVAVGRFLIAGDRGDPVAIAAFASLPAMLLFSLQRAAIFETVLFAFLYARPVLEVLEGGAPWRRPGPAGG